MKMTYICYKSNKSNLYLNPAKAHTRIHKTQYTIKEETETRKKTRPVNDIQYNEIIKSQVMQLTNNSQLKTISIPNETVHRMI